MASTTSGSAGHGSAWDSKPEICFIPLHGHTRGHCGVAVQTEGGWLLHCGDAASPYQRAADPHDLTAGPHVLDALHRAATRWLIGPHVPRIRQLIREHGDQVEVISAHDVVRYRAHTGRGHR
jgi:glyoxylase-like metal-dependent hydrolase (beta-lactamase superfamily II)